MSVRRAWTAAVSRCLGLGLASVLLALAGCKTGDRLWRVSPFEGRASSDRVNLWPIAYHNGDETSVLWPLFDVDDQGFALRPLVANDGAAWSVLFPLAAFDTESGEGWVGPFYSFGDNRGLLLLANVGPGLSWVGPFWWKEGSGGLFPLVYLGSGLSWAGPFWWSGTTAGLFPIAAFGSANYVGPVWWVDRDTHGVFPLYGRDLLGAGVNHVGPVWWKPGAETFEGGLWPLVDWAERGAEFSFLPFYSHDLGEDATRRTYLMGIGNVERSVDGRRSWWLPLWYHRAEPEREDTVFLPFFWKRTRGDSAEVYTLVGNRSVDPDSETLNVYPLWWSNDGDDSSWRMLFPLFWYEREGDARTLLTPLGGRGWSTTGESRFVNVLGPIYHHSEDLARGTARTAFLWPLYHRKREGDEVRTDIAALWSRSSSPEGSETIAAFGLGHGHGTAEGSSHRVWPLYSWSNEREVPGIFYDLTFFGRHVSGERTSTRLWPFLQHSSAPHGSEWNALFGLVHHDRSGAADAELSTRTWFWPLFSASHGTGEPSFPDVVSLTGWSAGPSGRHFQLGASLLYSHSSGTSSERSFESSRALLFFTHDEERLSDPPVPAAAPHARVNRVELDERGFLFDAFVSRTETFRAWRADAVTADEARVLRATWLGTPSEGIPDRAAARAVLAAHGAAPASDDPDELRAAIAAFAEPRTEARERRKVRLPFLWDYERTSDELDWSAPLGLARYAREPDRTRFSLLYYGYRSETANGTTSRDIFPFISWDTTPDGGRFSFLWRLLDYERKGSRRGGHVLFVPWGDA